MHVDRSVIVPYHRNYDMLGFCLKTLQTTLPKDVEIIVVGNNHCAAEIDIKLPKYVKYYKVYENLFYSAAINYGVQKATGSILTFCDPDTFYFCKWYEPLFDKLMSSPQIGAVSSKLINPLTGRIIDFGMSFTLWNAGHPTKELPYMHPLASKDREVQAACSAVMATRREHYELVGGMDETMPYSHPDCDYCLKLKEHGLQTWVVAESKAYHKGSSDSNNSKSYAFNCLSADSKGMFYAKNYHRITEDLHEWFAHTIKWARAQWPQLPSRYFLLDLCTMYNREYYYSAFTQNGINFFDKKVINAGVRDADKISLYHFISLELIDMAVPFLYFVDSYTSLKDNHLWFRMRDISRDIVIDRHGNIFPLSELDNENC